MRLSLGTFSIETTTFASRRELDELLQKWGGQPDLIDVANGEGSVFYLMKFVSELENSSCPIRYVGLCASRTGIEPQMLLNASSELVYVGLDSSLLIFNVRTGLIKRLTLGSPFYWMSLFADLNMVLVLHEIGLLCLTPKGDIVWSHDAGDIITSIALRAPCALEVGLFEGGRATVDLATGRRLNSSPD